MTRIDANSIVVGLTSVQTEALAQLLTKALLIIHTPLQTVKVFEEGDGVYVTCRNNFSNVKFLVRMMSGDGTISSISLHTVTKSGIVQDPFVRAWFDGDSVQSSTWVDELYANKRDFNRI